MVASPLCHAPCHLLYKDAHSVSNLGSQETELLAAGFPCIDVSRAGLRQGLQGKVRSNVAPAFTPHTYLNRLARSTHLASILHA